jgi:YesN/AraC family two-component response regulator
MALNSGLRFEMESIVTPMREISILVVEDEAITLEYLVTTLAKKFPAFALYQALNGRTGLERFKEHTPDIVITDINMPDMGGVQMANKIRVIKPDTKFIILTGDTGQLTLDASIGNGFEIKHFIVKPVDFQDLFGAIEQCVDEIMKHKV